MYDGKYIIPGLIVFVALTTFPIWKNMGNAGTAPNPEKPKGVTKCVESAQYMRTSHMKVLDDWRDESLRDGDRVSDFPLTTHHNSLSPSCRQYESKRNSPNPDFSVRVH